MMDKWEQQQEGIKKLKEYTRMLEAQVEDLQKELKFLDALYAAGVDNWEGYSYAQELMEDS